MIFTYAWEKFSPEKRGVNNASGRRRDSDFTLQEGVNDTLSIMPTYVYTARAIVPASVSFVGERRMGRMQQ